MTELIRIIREETLAAPDMTVMFVTNMWPDENRPYYGTFIQSQARSLVAANVQVDVAYVRGYLDASIYLRGVPTLARLVRRGQYHVIHAHYGHTATMAALAALRPLVISYCGEDLLGAPRDRGNTLKSRIEVRVFRRLSHIATATITKSGEMELALPPSTRGQNHVVPNGVDLARFAPMSRALARERLGWPVHGPVALFLGNPEDPRKNVHLARAAVELVAQELSDVRLVEAWAINPDDVPLYLNAADCLVFASRSEGSPNAIKEAMACELPIVATPVGDIPERLRDLAGCYVTAPTAEAFARSIRHAIRGPRSQEAREAVSGLSLDAVAARVRDVYDHVRCLSGGTETKASPRQEYGAAGTDVGEVRA